MPTIFRQNGFSFVIYIQDHAPMHVHVIYQGSEAVIEFVEEVALRDNFGLSRTELKRAMKIVGENQEFFQTKWRELND